MINPNGNTTNPSCNGYNDGSIITSASGGTGGYSYSWATSSSTSNTLTNLTAGTYGVTITDNSGCSVTDSYSISNPALLIAAVTSIQTYILNAAASGGTPPYSFQWVQDGISIPLATANTYTVGANGTYYVEVTDANNCISISNSCLLYTSPSPRD